MVASVGLYCAITTKERELISFFSNEALCLTFDISSVSHNRGVLLELVEGACHDLEDLCKTQKNKPVVFSKRQAASLETHALISELWRNFLLRGRVAEAGPWSFPWSVKSLL